MPLRMADDASTASPSGSPGALSRSIWAPRWPSNVRYGWRAHGVTVDQEQADSAVGQLRADDQGVSGVAGQHRVLPSAEQPRIALLHSRCRDILGGGRACAGLEVGKSQQPLTFGDLVEQFLLSVVADLGDDRPRSQRRVHDGFGRQPASDFGEHGHHFDLAGLIGVESQPENPGFGQLRPHLSAPAQVGGDDLVAALGVVAAGQ